ncbi:MAG TPA: F0F1 ATP synthase subunit epsilon [Steroidobacteraceae bacterium]
MQLRILLPFTIFALEDVVSIVVPTRSGSFGLLPHRCDCVAALAPGILAYTTAAGAEVNVAIDEGMLMKSATDVHVCVRRAVGGADLGKLRAAVEQQFLDLDEREKSARSTLTHLESGFIRRFVEMRHA